MKSLGGSTSFSGGSFQSFEGRFLSQPFRPTGPGGHVPSGFEGLLSQPFRPSPERPGGLKVPRIAGGVLRGASWFRRLMFPVDPLTMGEWFYGPARDPWAQVGVTGWIVPAGWVDCPNPVCHEGATEIRYFNTSAAENCLPMGSCPSNQALSPGDGINDGDQVALAVNVTRTTGTTDFVTIHQQWYHPQTDGETHPEIEPDGYVVPLVQTDPRPDPGAVPGTQTNGWKAAPPKEPPTEVTYTRPGRDEKRFETPGIVKVLGNLYGALTEIGDALDCIEKAQNRSQPGLRTGPARPGTPPRQRGGRLVDRLLEAANWAHTTNLAELTACLVANGFEDKVIGKINRAMRKAKRDALFEMGFGSDVHRPGWEPPGNKPIISGDGPLSDFLGVDTPFGI